VTPPTFLPVASGSRGKRGLEFASTRRLVELLQRYRALRDAPDSSPALRSYARSIIREIRSELNRRNAPKAAAA
jgi:hypothetical protein